MSLTSLHFTYYVKYLTDVYCIVWFVSFSVWDCDVYILSEIDFSFYFIILDQYLQIVLVNINIFLFTKKSI